MSINSELKKEGIEVISKLDTLKVNTICTNIASKLCLAFPEHNLNRSDLFASLCRMDMYIATMKDNDNACAKYFYKNNSIYFNEDTDLNTMATIAVHECIHHIQEILNENGELIKMGLYNRSSNFGLGLNEAAVQLMASEANMVDESQEVYFNIYLKTCSPDYYPLECALVSEMAYFTGTYPLYNSTLNSNNVFQNTFVAKSGKKTYNTISRNLDKLLTYENDLCYYSTELKYADKIGSIKVLKSLITSKKKDIENLFFKTQNLIIKKCFISEFNSIRNLEDIKIFTKKFYDFKDVMGYAENYTYYNDFYRYIMEEIEKKKEYIKTYGEINLFEPETKALVLVDNTKSIFSFAHKLIYKTKKLLGFNKDKVDINDF